MKTTSTEPAAKGKSRLVHRYVRAGKDGVQPVYPPLALEPAARATQSRIVRRAVRAALRDER